MHAMCWLGVRGFILIFFFRNAMKKKKGGDEGCYASDQDNFIWDIIRY